MKTVRLHEGSVKWTEDRYHEGPNYLFFLYGGTKYRRQNSKYPGGYQDFIYSLLKSHSLNRECLILSLDFVSEKIFLLKTQKYRYGGWDY